MLDPQTEIWNKKTEPYHDKNQACQQSKHGCAVITAEQFPSKNSKGGKRCSKGGRMKLRANLERVLGSSTQSHRLGDRSTIFFDSRYTLSPVCGSIAPLGLSFSIARLR
jgi:hypothetical protein